MGLTALFALIAIAIIIAAIVYIYNKNTDELFPPYQEPVDAAKQDIDPNWPFPRGPKP